MLDGGGPLAFREGVVAAFLVRVAGVGVLRIVVRVHLPIVSFVVARGSFPGRCLGGSQQHGSVRDDHVAVARVIPRIAARVFVRLSRGALLRRPHGLWSVEHWDVDFVFEFTEIFEQSFGEFAFVVRDTRLRSHRPALKHRE